MESETIREYRPLRECTSTGSVSYGIVQPGSHVEKGVPIIRVNNINDGSLDVTSPLKVDPQIDEKHHKTRLEGGEVLLSLVGTTGQCVVAGSELKGWNVARAIAVIKPAQGISAEWLSICLKSQAAQHYLDNRANTTVQKTLNLKDVREIPIMRVSETEERYILEWWTTLNDKIELNRKMKATLEAMAQALFKSWFVDFDHVIDNALAAGNPIPEALADRAEVRRQALAEGTANREAGKAFPDSFQETEAMGWIPEGWEVRELRAITSKISKGTTPRKSETTEALDPEIIPFLKVRDITDNGDLKDSDFDLIPRSIHEKSLKRSILTTGDVLFSIAGTIGRVTIVPSELNDSNINQAIAFIRPDGSINSMFILEHLRGSYVQDRIHSRVVQAVQANISLTEIGDIPVPIPSAKIHDAWLTNTTEIYQKIATLKLLNRSLTKLRDTLLPKLISGELRVSAP